MTKQEYDEKADEILRLIKPTPPMWYIRLALYAAFLGPLIILIVSAWLIGRLL